MNFKLTEDEHWVAHEFLPSWVGFQERDGAYGAVSSSEVSDGHVQIVFAPEGRDNAPLNESDLNLIEWFTVNESSVAASLLTGLAKEYKALRAEYIDDEYMISQMPVVSSEQEFKKLIGLHTVFIHQIDRDDGIPYIGFELGCTWDDEHGLGILMHGNRLVDVGGADTAFLLWVAEEDAKKT